MPLIKSSSEKAFRENVREMRLAGHPIKQALAASYRNQHEAEAEGHAKGGAAPSVIPGQMPAGGYHTPGAMAPIHMHGLIGGGGTGRSDSVPLRVPKGGYVVPADVVSGIGHGSSLAGGRALEHTFPFQDKDPRGRAHVRGFAPLMRPPFGEAFKSGTAKQHFAGGGHTGLTRILASRDEFYIHPQAIIDKYGDLKRGHHILDHWVMNRRRQTIKDMRKLKPPKGMKKK